ncbi:alpha/beta fold hydrolase [Halobacillus seohaensis]|uniref:Alpha/beta fold hydrolase n=1 Tax=Halobacillus seohaensis TaxID=447421 RepID=A0ABW2EN64_9BACI
MTATLYDSSNGLVEYSYQGEGPTLLLLKGGHSSRETDLSHSGLIYEGYSLLTVSRPGYDHTEVSTGRTPEEFAQTITEILDQLEIEDVTVIAISSAGPTAIALAVNHPYRINKLILEAALTTAWNPKTKRQARLFFGRGGKVIWKSIRLMLKVSPNLAVKQIMSSLTTDSVDDYVSKLSSNDRQFIYDLLLSSRSGKGFMLDINHKVLDMSQIKVPVLGMYTQKDKSVDYSNALSLQSNVPKCEIYEVKSDSHLIWIGENATNVWKKRLEFINN